LIDGQASKLQHYCTHVVAAGGLIINDKNEILLVQEKCGYRKDLWGLPGVLLLFEKQRDMLMMESL
jgi:ADP-ribose pyrophosphatase YjhB (NUDIX family)